MLLLLVLGLAVDYLPAGLAPNMPWLFMGGIFVGICGASYNTVNAYLADITGQAERAEVFSWFMRPNPMIVSPAVAFLSGSRASAADPCRFPQF